MRIRKLSLIRLALLFTYGCGQSSAPAPSPSPITDPIPPAPVITQTPAAATQSAPAATQQAEGPPAEVIKAAVDIRVPTADHGSHFSRGAGVIISTGEIVTATSVVTDEFGQLLDLRKLESSYADDGETETALQGGGIILGNAGYDICFIKSTVPLGRGGIKVGNVDPIVDDTVFAQSTAETKTGWIRGRMLGMSRDGRFIAISGRANKADDGGAVVDKNGNLIGIIVEGGKDIGVPFQAWRDPSGYHWRGVADSKPFSGDVILCARPFR